MSTSRTSCGIRPSRCSNPAPIWPRTSACPRPPCGKKTTTSTTPADAMRMSSSATPTPARSSSTLSRRPSATWFSWPRPEGISFPDKYHTVPANLAAIVREIVPREQVHINVPNGNWEHIVRQQLKENGCPIDTVYFHHIKTNESWCRDHGPAFVLRTSKSGKVEAAVVDWRFNAWGGKYPPFDDDDAVPTRVAEELGLPVANPGIIMEGGAGDLRQLLLRERRAARADLRGCEERPRGAANPSGANLRPASRRDRLHGTDLGTRRNPLPDSTTAEMVTAALRI